MILNIKCLYHQNILYVNQCPIIRIFHKYSSLWNLQDRWFRSLFIKKIFNNLILQKRRANSKKFFEFWNKNKHFGTTKKNKIEQTKYKVGFPHKVQNRRERERESTTIQQTEVNHLRLASHTSNPEQSLTTLAHLISGVLSFLISP